MAKKNALMVAIAAFLMISSSLAIVIDYNNSNDVSGDSVDYSDWIKISDPEQLSKIGSGEWTEIVGGEEIKHNYPVDGKYVLMNDIIFTDKDTGIDVDLNGGFDIEIEIVNNASTLELFLLYAGTSSALYSDDNMIISVNGLVLEETDAADLWFIFDSGVDVSNIPLNIIAYGTVNYLPAALGATNPNFYIAATLEFGEDTDPTDYVAPGISSNGNMDPLCAEDPFTGTFHGNGKKIIGLETVVYSDGDSYSGLFAKAEGATFDGIELIDGYSVAISSSSTSSANSYAGGLVGNGGGIMTNCYNTGDVSSSGTISSAGGLVGYGNTSSTITMTDCYNTGDVAASGTVSYAGGLVGRSSDAITMTMTNCYNTGDVTTISTSRSSNAGGLVGYGNTTMTDCHNTGNVTATSSSSTSCASGLVGSGSTTMTNCYNEGNVIATAFRNSYAGGLVGNGGGTITNCYNMGDISASTSTTETNLNSYAGGLVGYGTNTLTMTMTDCYNMGDVTASTSYPYSYSYAGGLVGYGSSTVTMTDCYNTGDVMATWGAGGLVGVGIETITMENCYNMGDVTASSPSSNAGGLVGYGNSTITMTNCYNMGDISASGTPSHAGGLVGFGNKAITMENCYNRGNVSATSTSSSSAYAGGLVGYGADSITITDCYNRGNVSATSSSSSSYAGGLVGYGADSITIMDCYNTGDVTAPYAAGGLVGYGSSTMTNCYNTGDVTTSCAAGGLVGSGAITMTNCYNTGDVTASSTSAYSFAGGLVGFGNTTMTMTDCYNRGNVSATSTSSSYAGGLSGYVDSGNVTMTNCYSTGTLSVSGTDAHKGGVFGDYGGSSTVYITNCYFSDNAGLGLDLCGNNITNLVIDGLRGGDQASKPSGARTFVELARIGTYYDMNTEYRADQDSPTMTLPGWDFSKIWCIDNNVNDGYPFLRSTVIMGQPSDVTADKVDGNVFSIRLGATGTGGTVQWQKLTGGQWNDITGATDLTYTTKATDAFGDQFRCVVTLGNETFTSDSASLLDVNANKPGDGDGNGGDDGGDNMMLYVGIAAVAVIAVIGVVYFMFIRKP